MHIYIYTTNLWRGERGERCNKFSIMLLPYLFGACYSGSVNRLPLCSFPGSDFGGGQHSEVQILRFFPFLSCSAWEILPGNPVMDTETGKNIKLNGELSITMFYCQMAAEQLALWPLWPLLLENRGFSSMARCHLSDLCVSLHCAPLKCHINILDPVKRWSGIGLTTRSWQYY